MIKKLNKHGFLSILIVLFAYFTESMLKKSPSLPTLDNLFRSAVSIFTSIKFYDNAFYTIRIVCTGVFIAFVFGSILAIICSMNETLNSLIMPIVNSMKNIPSIALFPLFIVLMGIGDTPRIFVIIWNSVYPIISSTLFGLNSVPAEIVEAAENCGAKKWQLYFYIKIPLALINILDGLKISLGNGFIAIVVAEMLGATKGLGYMVLWSSNTFKYSDMYIYILVIALIGFLINVVIEKIIKVAERKIYYEEKKLKKNRSECTDSSDVDNGTVGLWEETGNIKDEVCRTESL